MQPDNEEIIKAVAELQVATRRTMVTVLEYGATANTLGALVQVIGILQECYAPPPPSCHGMNAMNAMSAAGAVGIFGGTLRRSRDEQDDDLPPEIERAINEAIEEYAKSESIKKNEAVADSINE